MPTLYYGCDHAVAWLGAKAAGAPLTTATVTWTLKASDLTTTVASGTLTHEAAGTYRGVIESSVFSAQSGTGRLDVTLVSGGYNDERRDSVTYAYRPFSG